jgi:hypothetical protein
LKHQGDALANDLEGRKQNALTAKQHGNTAGDQEAILYKRVDKDGNLVKHGITQDMDKRYSKKELGSDKLIEVERGPRKEVLKKERDLVETNPGPKNKEKWAGRRRK